MEYTINEQPSELREIMNLFYYIKNEETIEERFEETLDKFGINKELYAKKRLKEIYSYIKFFKENCVIRDEQLSLYFKDVYRKDDHNYFAEIIFADMSLDEMKKYQEDLALKSSEEINADIIKKIINEIEEQEVGEASEKLKDNKLFIEYLNTKDIEVEAKWSILMILSDPHRYITDLIDIIFGNLEVYKKAYKLIENVNLTLVQELKKSFEDDENYLSNRTGIIVDKSKAMVIYPSIISFKDVTMRDKDDVNCVYFGCRFAELMDNIKSSKGKQGNIQNIIKVLGDKSKYDIIQFLKKNSLYGQELADRLGVTTATVSHHMNILLVYGLVNVEKRENKVYYSLNNDNIELFITGLKEQLL